MWIIKQFNHPGPDYGKYQVGYFENLAGDSIFRGIGDVYEGNARGLYDAAKNCNYLNGGTNQRDQEDLLETLRQVSDNLVKKMTFRDW
jgi:hypothetical protein